jgi:predicted small lipoprotein YifL
MRARLAAAALLAVAACGTKDPVYLDPAPRAIEVDPDNMVESATASVQLPVELETEAQNLARQRLAMDLGLDLAQVPQARRDDYQVEIEWTVKNLSAEEGTAFVNVAGASEYFVYDPTLFQLDPRDPVPPPLVGGIPIVVPGNGSVSGTFREDQISEAAQDWDAVSRAGVVLQNALITQWPTEDVNGGMGGELVEIPSAAVAALVRFDVTLDADRHMVLEYVLRVRDRGDRLAPFETDLGRLVPPSETAYEPPPPPED